MRGGLVLYERAGEGGLCPSPICWRARIALALKELSVERRAMRFADVEELAAITGSRTVPVLADGDAMVIGSDVIAEHLDSTVATGPRLMGEAAVAMSGMLERDMGARVLPLVAADHMERLVPEDRAYYQESREARFGRSFAEIEEIRDGLQLDLAFSLGRLEPRLEEYRYLGGDEISWADVVAYSYLLWIAVASPRSMPELVNPVRTWFERHDAIWRPICLEPSIPEPEADDGPDPEPTP